LAADEGKLKVKVGMLEAVVAAKLALRVVLGRGFGMIIWALVDLGSEKVEDGLGSIFNIVEMPDRPNELGLVFSVGDSAGEISS